MKNSRFKDIRVLVFGLGINQGGLGVARYMISKGAHVTITDMKSEEELRESIHVLREESLLSRVQLVLGEHRFGDIDEVDIVIKNPAVPLDSPYIQYAKNQGKQVTSEFNIFFEEIASRQDILTIGVTGTRGKSTTVALLYTILSKVQSRPVFLVGNIRKSGLEILDEILPNSIICMELSSFQLEDMVYSPDIAVLTNIFPDHLNRHHTLQEYTHAKEHIFLYQKAGGIIFINGDDSTLTNLSFPSTSTVKRVSSVDTAQDYCTENGTFRSRSRILARVDALQLIGEHNQRNALMALAVVDEVVKTEYNQATTEKALEEFTPVSGRLEPIAWINGVQYVNDATSSMPEALFTALRAYQDRRVVLIVGGNDKGLEYEIDQNIIEKSLIQKVFITPGTAQEKLKKIFAKEEIQSVSSLKEAVHEASLVAKDGDVVLFSPGATSFFEFRNEFERSDVFVDIVYGLQT